MLRIGAPVVLVGLLSLVVLGCDEKDKKSDLVAKTVGSATVIDAGGMALPAPAASSAAPAAAKPPKECPPGGDVTFDDPELENEIRAKLKKPKESAPTLTAKDLAAVPSVKITGQGKAPLTELDACVFPKLTGLKFLYLPKGTYSDLTPIAGLTKLESLFMTESGVSDLKPLEKLTALDQLGLAKTKVKDLAPIAGLVNLTEIVLDDTEVSDLTPLMKMTKLQTVSLRNTQVKDISPLADLKKLKTLNVAGTGLLNIDTLDPLKKNGLKINLK